MDIRGSYQMMCRATNGGFAAMAAAQNMSSSSLENRIYGRKGQRISVDLALSMQATSGTKYFAAAVAHASGGVFVELPQHEQLDNIDIHEKYVELLDRVGALARKYREATGDGVVDKSERRTLEFLGNTICQLVTQINLMTFKIYCQADK